MAPTVPAGPIPAFVAAYTLSPVIVLTVLATVAVILRIVSLRTAKVEFRHHSDLWLIVSSLIVAWGDTIEMLVAAGHGGVGYSELPLKEAAVFFSWIEFANVPLNTTAMALVRLSVLQFYKIIFATRITRFNWVANTLIALVISWWLIGFIPAFASLSPSTHFDHEAYILGLQGFAIGLDCLILCLPVPLLWKIHMPLKRKLKVLAILWLGSSCVAFAGLRYHFLAAPANRGTSSNVFTYVNGRDADLWGRLEPLAAIITACLPTYGPLAHSPFIADALRSVRSLRSLQSRPSVDDTNAAMQLGDLSYQGKTNYSASVNAESVAKSSNRPSDSKDGALNGIHVTRGVHLEHDQAPAK